MSSAMIGVFIGLIAAGLLFLCGYATLILPREKALRLATGRVVNAFGAEDSIKWVRFIGVFMMIAAAGITIGALSGLLKDLGPFVTL